jgi:hypothetical protein
MLSQNGGTNYPVMQHHMSDEHNPQLHHSKNLKTRICILYLPYLRGYTVYSSVNDLNKTVWLNNRSQKE